MRVVEAEDEEATAASAALTVLREIWGDRAFTAKDVVEVMTGCADNAKAEDLANALGELEGKPLDRPTAQKLGKLFQKALIDKPAWIGDGLAVAILKRAPGHNANIYRVQVSASGQDFAAGSSPDRHPYPRPKQSPHPPHSPSDGETGNDGKEGKDFRVDGADFPNPNRAAPGWRGRL